MLVRDVCSWYAVCPFTLTDVHSLFQTNKLLSYVPLCYETLTWSLCAGFPINSFTDCFIGAIFSGQWRWMDQWRTHRRTKRTVTVRASLAHTGQELQFKEQWGWSSAHWQTHYKLFHSYNISGLQHSLLGTFHVYFSFMPQLDLTLHSLTHIIVNLQSACTDGTFYLVHKYICLLILGPTPAQNQITEPCVNVCCKHCTHISGRETANSFEKSIEKFTWSELSSSVQSQTHQEETVI